MKTYQMRYRHIDRFYRHFIILKKHLTFKRIVNVIIVLLEYSLRLPKLRSKPFLLKVETSSVCNLKCDGCRSGNNRLELNEGIMTLQTFEKILKEVGDYIIEVSLYIWGEPFTNKDLCKMIELSNKYNIGSIVSTNLHFMNEKIAKSLINSKLDKLIIAIDGATKESYEKIRIGGDFDKVMKNIELLANYKKIMKSEFPLIEWQFIRTDFNQNEINIAQEMAIRLKIDNFVIVPDWSKREKDIETKRKRMKAYKQKRKICRWLWFAIAIQWNGDLWPCCHVRNEKDKFGNIYETDILEIWNGIFYRNSRRKFAIKNNKLNSGEEVCFRCPV